MKGSEDRNERSVVPDVVRGAMFVGATISWVLAAGALWLGAAMTCVDGACYALYHDQKLLGMLHDARHPWLDGFFAAITWLGSIVVLLPAALALAWRYRRRGYHAAALLLPLAVAGAWLFAHLAKLLFTRPRPDLYAPLINMPADLSFPSAHAMQIAAFAIAWVLAPGQKVGWTRITLAATLVLLVALSRLYLQVHFPSDVLFGLIAGAGWALGLCFLLGNRK